MEPIERYSAGLSTLLEEKIAAARSDFGAFFEFVFRDAEGNAVKMASIHHAWQIHIEYCWKKGLIPAVLAPWAHAKTSVITVARTAYEIGRNINLRVKIVCQNDAKAMERVMGISSLISSPRYQMVFPGVREVTKEAARSRRSIARWTQHELFIQRPGFAIDPTIQAAGVLSAGTGGRADVICFDDVVDQKNAIDEPALRDKVANNIDNVWMSRLEPSGRVLFVGTPWHGDDYTHRILNRSAWCVLRQWIAEDFKRIEQEVHNAPEDYPLPFAIRELQTQQTQTVESSNISSFAYDPGPMILDVQFKNGTRYYYYDVPKETYVSFTASTSKGQFFSQVIKGKFKYKKAEDLLSNRNGHV